MIRRYLLKAFALLPLAGLAGGDVAKSHTVRGEAGDAELIDARTRSLAARMLKIHEYRQLIDGDQQKLHDWQHRYLEIIIDQNNPNYAEYVKGSGAIRERLHWNTELLQTLERWPVDDVSSGMAYALKMRITRIGKSL